MVIVWPCQALQAILRQVDCFRPRAPDVRLASTRGESIVRAMTIITYIGAGLATLILFATFSSASGAPQEAAGAALALAVVAIPYCVTATLQRARLLAIGRVD
jgi:microcompartment protein CcmK/EutM